MVQYVRILVDNIKYIYISGESEEIMMFVYCFVEISTEVRMLAT